jgi:1,4-dihydroxy-2-naphthoate octaprenyltransferase
VTTVTALDIALTQLSGRVLFGTLCAILMIGAGYPLTQIYQHDQDRADGVETLSMKLGVRGTLFFSLTLFGLFTGLMLFFWWDSPPAPLLFLVFTAPTALYFLYWTSRVWVNEAQANYDNTMRMNLISTVSLNAFFITLLLIMPWNL